MKTQEIGTLLKRKKIQRFQIQHILKNNNFVLFFQFNNIKSKVWVLLKNLLLSIPDTNILVIKNKITYEMLHTFKNSNTENKYLKNKLKIDFLCEGPSLIVFFDNARFFQLIYNILNLFTQNFSSTKFFSNDKLFNRNVKCAQSVKKNLPISRPAQFLGKVNIDYVQQLSATLPNSDENEFLKTRILKDTSNLKLKTVFASEASKNSTHINTDIEIPDYALKNKNILPVIFFSIFFFQNVLNTKIYFPYKNVQHSDSTLHDLKIHYNETQHSSLFITLFNNIFIHENINKNISYFLTFYNYKNIEKLNLFFVGALIRNKIYTYLDIKKLSNLNNLVICFKKLIMQFYKFNYLFLIFQNLKQIKLIHILKKI